MKLYIVRHADKRGEDYYNPILKHQDQPISKKGKSESRKLYQYFKDKHITRIFVSYYIRTRQTIEFTSKKLRIPPVVDSRLNEIDNGVIEQLTDEEIRITYPDIWLAYSNRSSDFRFPEGETGEEAQERITGFIEEKKHATGNTILVTHDGLIRALFCYVVGIPVYKRFDFRIDTCGIMEIEQQENSGEWKLIRFNYKTT